MKKHAKITLQTFAIDDLQDHPRNPRKHPEPGTPEWVALRKSLENVYYDPLVLNKRNSMLVSGHLRKKIFKDMGIAKVDCVVIDVDENTHIALLMSANNQAGEFDRDDVIKLLQEIEGSIDLTMTGFSEENLTNLLQGFDVLPTAENPFGQFGDATNPNGDVAFSFGEFKTNVRKDVYGAFSDYVTARQRADTTLLIDDILADLIPSAEHEAGS